jgi:hypothetical protein
MEVCCENPADHVFVDVDAECQGDLLGNPLAAPSAIAPFHFKDRVIGEFHKSSGDGSLIEAATVLLPPI